MAAASMQRLFDIPDRLPPTMYGAESALAEAHWLDQRSPLDLDSARTELAYYDDYYRKVLSVIATSGSSWMVMIGGAGCAWGPVVEG
jgi:hypothetical protein